MKYEDYFMNIARVVASKSKDPSSKVGCVIVDREGKIVSTGYNGMVQGAIEKELTYERPLKYELILHAEMNALIFAKRDLRNCDAYITHGPCPVCLKLLLQSGIRDIIYEDVSIMKLRGTLDQKQAIKMLIRSTGAIVQNTKGEDYTKELYDI